MELAALRRCVERGSADLPRKLGSELRGRVLGLGPTAKGKHVGDRQECNVVSERTLNVPDILL